MALEKVSFNENNDSSLANVGYARCNARPMIQRVADRTTLSLSPLVR